ncbi:hypothetical protein TrVFT333_004982 [Trichoderma virens FT-333]|nr:hypothetical protein TrVFT333_004982 [Trichoderma virens FT-333]
MSLINAPRIDAQADSLPNLRSFPTVRDNEAAQERVMRYQAAEEGDLEPALAPAPEPQPERFALPGNAQLPSLNLLPRRMRTASNSSSASFDTSDPAMTPTMTREEALAKIRERRGRARSTTRGAATPQSRPTSGMGRRVISNSTGTVGSRSRSRNA